jgi:hypothetical protein
MEYVICMKRIRLTTFIKLSSWRHDLPSYGWTSCCEPTSCVINCPNIIDPALGIRVMVDVSSNFWFKNKFVTILLASGSFLPLSDFLNSLISVEKIKCLKNKQNYVSEYNTYDRHIQQLLSENKLYLQHLVKRLGN